MMRFDSVSVTRPYEQIVSQIEEGVRDGRLVAGQQLPTERELGAQFGVGRGVVREALKVLGAMGLVESRQGSGIFVRNDPLPTVSRVFTFVSSPSEESVDQLFEFRRELECLAAGWAASRRSDNQANAMLAAAEASRVAALADDEVGFGAADREFHGMLHEATGNPYLQATLGAVRGMQTDVIGLFTNFAGSILVASIHHLAIAQAISSRDPGEAAELMDTHIRYTSARVAEILAEKHDALIEKGGHDTSISQPVRVAAG